jgi:hypothetical protein
VNPARVLFFKLGHCRGVGVPGLRTLLPEPVLLLPLTLVAMWKSFQTATLARYRWLTPIILGTQETEIRRITVQSQSGQIALILKNKNQITKKRVGKVA